MSNYERSFRVREVVISSRKSRVSINLKNEGIVLGVLTGEVV